MLFEEKVQTTRQAEEKGAVAPRGLGGARQDPQDRTQVSKPWWGLNQGFWMWKGRRRGCAGVKPQAAADAYWHWHPWVFRAPSPSAVPSGHPGGCGGL